MSWIKTVPYAEATGKLKKLYDRVKGPDDNVDNIMMSHSLRPHTMEGHMAIYKNVLHHTGNTLPKWFLELIGVWVSALNECDYCVEHHFAGMKRLLNDDARADTLREAIEDGDVDVAPITDAEKMALGYAAMLTLTPSKVPEEALKALRSVGFEDGQILEINQVTAYFNYANRTVLGLGCDTEGDVIGLSPNNSDDPDDWGHR
ncbi:carboxymuconolactone decarboxylase family protein [Profundibacter sp.]|uniref:carboxymuconolactone decarboxylase family protein n=1 Tax=Profundibacter sp. TaxID=3101071 RepID=UPI003D0ED913